MTEQAEGMHFFVADVRNIQDPNEGGKVQICVHGHHNIGDKPIPDDDLPWAHCIMNNSPSINGIGESVAYVAGSTVVGFWLDGDRKQIPYIIGSSHRGAQPKG